jgi:hypothetical protein
MSIAMGGFSVEQALTPADAPRARVGRLAYYMRGPSTSSSPRWGNAPGALGPCSSMQTRTGRDAPDRKLEGSTPSHPDVKTTVHPDPVSERTYRRPRQDGRLSTRVKIGLAIRSVTTRLSAAGRIPQAFDSLEMGTDCGIRAVAPKPMTRVLPSRIVAPFSLWRFKKREKPRPKQLANSNADSDGDPLARTTHCMRLMVKPMILGADEPITLTELEQRLDRIERESTQGEDDGDCSTGS